VNESITNFRVDVQLKGTNTTYNQDASLSISIRRANLNYLLAQPKSIYVCYHGNSQTLLVRFAEDIVREYEHKQGDWDHQKTLSVTFREVFSTEFQQKLHKQVLAYGNYQRDQRVKWGSTSPQAVKPLSKQPNPIDVPTNPEQAELILDQLYSGGSDQIISCSFDQFAAVLGSKTQAMILAYMAEINLGINHFAINESRIREGILVLESHKNRGKLCNGSIQYSIGNAWLALKEYPKAIQAFQDAVVILENSQFLDLLAQCYKNFGHALSEVGEIQKAREYHEKSLEYDPNLGEALLALALWHRRNKSDPLLILDYLDRIIKKGNSALQNTTIQGWRLEQLFISGQIDNAFREVFSLLNSDSSSNWVLPWCAKHVASFGKQTPNAAKKAILFWERYFEEYPEDQYAKKEFLLCNWLLHSEHDATRISFHEFKNGIKKLIEKGDPDEAFLWDRIAHWAQDDSNWIEAKKYYRKAYDLNQKDYGYCFGTALNFLRQYQDALPILLEQAESFLSDAMSWFQVAVAYCGLGDLEASISAYQKAIALDPNYDLAWFNLGGMLWNSGNIERAIEIWTQAIQQFPNHELAKELEERLNLGSGIIR